MGAPLLGLLFACISAAQNPEGLPSWTTKLAYQPKEIFPITIGSYGFPCVSVRINGSPVEMLLDTGNMSGIFVAPSLAQSLGLPQIGSSSFSDADGTRMGSNPVFRIKLLEAFGRVWKEQRVQGDSRYPLNGAIGPRLFLGKRFTLDYQKRLLGISESPLPRSLPQSNVLPMFPARGLEGMIVISGSLNGKEILLQIDTGKSRTCVDPELASSLQLPTSARGFRIENIRIGSSTFSALNAKPLGFKGISQGLPQPILLGIGSDILSQFVWTVDYTRQLFAIAK